jgi:glycosyltransferase involved in cell wall biosynthesis
MNIVVDLRPLIGGKTSGVEIYIRNLLKHLLSMDKDNKYILWINAFSDQSDIFKDFSSYNLTKIQTKIPNKSLNLSLFLFGRPLIDKLFKQSVDAFLMPDLRPVALSKDVKKICVIHDLSFKHFPQFFSFKTRIWHKILRVKKTLESFGKIIAVSEFTKHDIINTYGIPQKKISVIHEGSPDWRDAISEKPRIKSVTLKYGLPKRYILFLSTLEPRKNLKRTIFAFNEFKKNDHSGIKLLIAGKTHPSIFAEQGIKANPDVHFAGFIDEEDKEIIYKNADAFIYPSLFEGFGLPLLEAMSAGTPIIASNAGSIPEICGNAAIFFNPLNTEEIAECMKKILEPEIREKLKKEMSAQIKKYSWEKCAAETLAEINSL